MSKFGFELISFYYILIFTSLSLVSTSVLSVPSLPILIRPFSSALQPSSSSLYDLTIRIFYESHAFVAIAQLSFFSPIQLFASFPRPTASTPCLKLYYNCYHYSFDYWSNAANTDDSLRFTTVLFVYWAVNCAYSVIWPWDYGHNHSLIIIVVLDYLIVEQSDLVIIVIDIPLNLQMHVLDVLYVLLIMMAVGIWMFNCVALLHIILLHLLPNIKSSYILYLT